MRPPWARTPLRLLLSHFPASAHQPHPCPRSLPVPVHRTASVLWAGPSVLCVRLALRPCEPQCARPHGGAQIPAPTPVGPRDSGRLASACRRCRPVPTVFFLAPAWAPSRGAAAGGRRVSCLHGAAGSRGSGPPVGRASIKGAGAAEAASPGFLNTAS